MKKQTLTQQAVAAMENAIRKVIRDHKKRNRPMAVWQDGKVVMLNPEMASMVREDHTKYGQ
ncbi:MAG: hypothetical protein PHR77_13140 [Kiritimatiellae bacterium]|nr:hypothetical protein [Kiritimatiellia bacterium]MDD5520178.1 hypothetical protein [Kiritimatiellia bacterium]